jgi:arylsulfatase A-like enzyme
MKTYFPFWLGLALAATVVSSPTAPAADNPARPNFAFIYTDDQRHDAMGVVQREQGERGRFPWFESPNMDRLAAEGVRFRNAFVTKSLCSPSRTAFLTGRYNHLNGVANNHTPFPVDNVTHATLLRKAGYTTGYIGKWHMGQQRVRPGFDYFASFVGQGRYVDCPFLVNGEVTETKGWVDDVSADYAIGFLKANKDKPFSLVVGFKSPHGPWAPPERLQDKFKDAEARPAPNATPAAPYKGKFVLPNRPAAARPAAARPASRGQMIQNYFRVIYGADENLGKILKTLDELNLAENTVVIFTSDNGFYLGEHGLGDKRSAYDESMRIPLIVRYPKLQVKGKVLDQMALNIDLAPTLLDFAGVPIPGEMQGRSWRPLLEGKTTDWRKSFFYEYFFENTFAIPTVLAVRTETAKLVKYPGHDEWNELFDLKSDPYEMNNLIGTNKKLLTEMEAEFERQSKAVDFKIPANADKPPP